jgi:hypothetical protein
VAVDNDDDDCFWLKFQTVILNVHVKYLQVIINYFMFT